MNKEYLIILINKIDSNISYIVEFNEPINFNLLFNFKNRKYVIEDIILEELLNYYICNIKNIYINRKYIQSLYLINNIYKQCTNKINRLIVDEANIISDDIIQKITNVNKRTIVLPLKIDILKEYSISSIIFNKDLNLVIELIILRLAIISFSLKLS